MLTVCAGVGVVALWTFASLGAVADTNITLLSIPVNLTSAKLSLQRALHHPLTRPLEKLNETVHEFADFAKNGSVSCADEGEQCIPGVPSCCPSGKEDDEDLQCLPAGDSYSCGRLNDSVELAQQRLDALQYGDSMGMLASHPWAYSWEFQSMSAIEREEAQAAEEADWKKHWKPSSVENIWIKTYKKMKKTGKDFWHDLRKMKKLKEIKATLIDKYKQRRRNTKPPQQGEPLPEESPVMYPEETSERSVPEDALGNKESEESVIKFSDEIPKREKKIDFRIDDIIKDAVDLVDKKLKKKARAHKEREEQVKPPGRYPSAERPFRLDKIEDTEDELMREISELKKLKEMQEQKKQQARGPNEPDIEELIRRQVAAILEEERKLDKLKKIEELRRIEESMKQQGGLKQ